MASPAQLWKLWSTRLEWSESTESKRSRSHSLANRSCLVSVQAAIRAARRNSSTACDSNLMSYVFILLNNTKQYHSFFLQKMFICEWVSFRVSGVCQVGLRDFEVAVSDFLQSRESTRHLENARKALPWWEIERTFGKWWKVLRCFIFWRRSTFPFKLWGIQRVHCPK